MRGVYAEIKGYFIKYDVHPAPVLIFETNLLKDLLHNISDVIETISMLFVILRKNMYSRKVGTFEGLVIFDILTKNLLSCIVHNANL